VNGSCPFSAYKALFEEIPHLLFSSLHLILLIITFIRIQSKQKMKIVLSIMGDYVKVNRHLSEMRYFYE